MRRPWNGRTPADTPAGSATTPVAAMPPRRRNRDPWTTNDDRVREINATSPRAKRRWLPRRHKWLRATP